MSSTVVDRTELARWRPSGRRRRFVRVLIVLIVLGLITVAVTAYRARASNAGLPIGCRVAGASTTYALDQDQAANAVTIAAVAMRDGLPAHAVTIALTAAFQESNLRNLEYGDRDSLGLFQQRPSQGWGTPKQLLDPSYAAGAFFNALTRVGRWQQLSVTDAAQTVQRSAAPDAYTRWEGTARDVAAAVTGEVPVGLACRYRSTVSSVPPPAFQAALGRESGVTTLATGLPEARSWAVAAWLIGHADEYRIASVSLRGQQWTADSGKWRPDPSAGPAIDVRQS